jgi:hypothetical protein
MGERHGPIAGDPGGRGPPAAGPGRFWQRPAARGRRSGAGEAARARAGDRKRPLPGGSGQKVGDSERKSAQNLPPVAGFPDVPAASARGGPAEAPGRPPGGEARGPRKTPPARAAPPAASGGGLEATATCGAREAKAGENLEHFRRRDYRHRRGRRPRAGGARPRGRKPSARRWEQEWRSAPPPWDHGAAGCEHKRKDIVP